MLIDSVSKKMKKEAKGEDKYMTDAIRNYPITGEILANHKVTVGYQLAQMINDEHDRQNDKTQKEPDTYSYSDYSELDVEKATKARLHIKPAKAMVARSKEYAIENGLEIYPIQRKALDMAAQDDEEDDLIRKFKLQ